MTHLAPRSLRGRLLLWLLLPLLLIGVAALIDANRAARQTADEISDRLLAGSVLAIAEQVFVNDSGELEVDIPYVALQMLTSSADDRVFYRIEDAQGRFVTGYRQLDLNPPRPAQQGETVFFDSHFRGSPIRVASFTGAASSSSKSLVFRVGVAETTNARTAIADSILLRSALRQGILILAAAILVWLAVTRALAPLATLKKAIDRRSPDDVRPIRHRVPQEVEGVVDKINDLLLRFSSAIDALRNFTANTSHQFRTPLALIRTHLELANRAPTRSERESALEDASRAVGDAERLMGQMLLLSRLDSLSREDLIRESCDLAAIARSVCEDFVLYLSAHGRHDVQIGFDGEEETLISARATLVREVLRNLIDNAIVHNRSDVTIDVHVELKAGTPVLSVTDDGQFFARTEGILEKTNWDRSLKPSSSGSGLGLRIVTDILHLFDARLEFHKADSGGTCARIIWQPARTIEIQEAAQ